MSGDVLGSDPLGQPQQAIEVTLVVRVRVTAATGRTEVRERRRDESARPEALLEVTTRVLTQRLDAALPRDASQTDGLGEDLILHE